MNPIRRALALVALLVLSACGGGDGQITGTITGLTASGLVLSDGVDSLTLSSGATSFTFPTVLTDGVTYNVHVTTQPAGLYCTVANGSGTVSSSTPSADITVTCAASFSLSGVINGLTTSGLVINDGFESLSVSAGPSFAFPTLLADGDSYNVTITTQPTGQTCSVTSGGSGTVAGAAVTNVVITCK